MAHSHGLIGVDEESSLPLPLLVNKTHRLAVQLIDLILRQYEIRSVLKILPYQEFLRRCREGADVTFYPEHIELYLMAYFSRNNSARRGADPKKLNFAELKEASVSKESFNAMTNEEKEALFREITVSSYLELFEAGNALNGEGDSVGSKRFFYAEQLFNQLAKKENTAALAVFRSGEVPSDYLRRLLDFLWGKHAESSISRAVVTEELLAKAVIAYSQASSLMHTYVSWSRAAEADKNAYVEGIEGILKIIFKTLLELYEIALRDGALSGELYESFKKNTELEAFYASYATYFDVSKRYATAVRTVQEQYERGPIMPSSGKGF